MGKLKIPQNQWHYVTKPSDLLGNDGPVIKLDQWYEKFNIHELNEIETCINLPHRSDVFLMIPETNHD